MQKLKSKNYLHDISQCLTFVQGVSGHHSGESGVIGFFGAICKPDIFTLLGPRVSGRSISHIDTMEDNGLCVYPSDGSSNQERYKSAKNILVSKI